MKILVSGASGFCGGAIVWHLLKLGYEVVGHSRKESQLVSNFKTKYPSTFSPCIGDLSTLTEIPHDITGVVHCASCSPLPQITPQDYILNNIQATNNLALAGSKIGIKFFIFLSSVSVNGRVRGSVVDENTPISRPNLYGASKLLGETCLAAYINTFPSVSLRLPGMVGQNASRNWLSNLAAKALKGETLNIFNPDAQFNNLVDVEDLAVFIGELIDRKLNGFDCITLGCRGSLSIGQIAERVVIATGGLSKIAVVPPIQGSFTISSDRAIRRYNYKPGEFEDVLRRYLSTLQKSRVIES